MSCTLGPNFWTTKSDGLSQSRTSVKEVFEKYLRKRTACFCHLNMRQKHGMAFHLRLKTWVDFVSKNAARHPESTKGTAECNNNIFDTYSCDEGTQV